MRKQFKVSPSKVTASDDYEEGSSYFDATEEKDFFDIENEVFAELGIYVDFSSVRGNSGTLFIYADPTHECSSDVWDGDEDAEITSVPFEDYSYEVEERVLAYPEEEWEVRFKDYVETLIS